jgi:hypothetical protein
LQAKLGPAVLRFLGSLKDSVLLVIQQKQTQYSKQLIMKKLLLTTTFLVAGAIGLMAQGKVGFDNNPYIFADSIEVGGSVDYLVYSAPGVPVADATWTAQLFQDGVAVGAQIPFYGDAFAGVWGAGVDPDAGVRSLNTAGGVAATLEVRVFDGTGAFLGASDPFQFTPSTSATPPPSDLLISNFRGFVVPEPSTIALGVLGLGALLLFRRRK